MKFKLDENVPFSIKGIIELRGDHLVDSVHHEKLDGTRDPDLLKFCMNEKRILITLDHDFFGITLSPKHQYYGIILIRSKTQGKKAILALFEKFLATYNIETAKGKFITIEPAGIKIR